MSRFALRPGEAIIRSDLAVITRGVFAWRCRPGRATSLRYFGRRRRITLTDERVVMELLGDSWWSRAFWFCFAAFKRHVEFGLRDVTKIDTFEHPVSAAAVIDCHQAGGVLSYLLVGNGWLGRERTVDELLRHASAVRAAVTARRAVGAASGEATA